MAYRIVGALSLVFGIVLVTCALQAHRLSREIADPALITKWTSATRADFLVRSDIAEVALGLCGVATIVGGLAMFLRRGWAMPCLLVGSLFPIVYAPLTRVFAPSQYRMDGPDLPDLFFGCFVAMLAALAFAVRRRRVNA
jgi:hypothetical protein